MRSEAYTDELRQLDIYDFIDYDDYTIFSCVSCENCHSWNLDNKLNWCNLTRSVITEKTSSSLCKNKYYKHKKYT